MATRRTTGKKTGQGGPTKVEAVKHQDKRTNIPTDELRGFVADDEKEPQKLSYPRDPSLDPQLVWRGKDEQDRADLEVPAIPIYIQEKVHPRVIIENLRQTSAKSDPEPEMSLFSDFNGIEFEDLVEFYQHEQDWSNRFILGDALSAMTSLAEKENLRGKVQVVYVDPPYGIGFGSNWQASTRKREVKDGRREDVTRQPEQIRAFRDTWEDGIHSYLSYLRDRLTVARDLLTPSGSCFVQIGDENLHLVRSLMDEVFGAENFVNLITFRKTSPLGTAGLPAIADFILWFAKDASQVKTRSLYQAKRAGAGSMYTRVELADGTRRKMTAEERRHPDLVPEGARPYAIDNLRSSGYTESCFFPITVGSRTFPPQKYSWKTNRAGVARLIMARRIEATESLPYYVRFHDDFPVIELNNVWLDTRGEMDMTYVVQTATRVVERCLLMASDPGDIVLDPTCGSGTTALVAERWGRRWITIDTSRVALALARTRLMAARYPAFLLADSAEGRKREEQLSGRGVEADAPQRDIKKGFVYRRVPHVTLRSVAQNPEIVDGLSGAELDALIARHAEQEMLVDQPYEDPNVVRVTGPFTVEGLSPHRLLHEDDQAQAQAAPESSRGYEDTILANLQKAGVQNRDRNQRLEFTSLETFAGGRWLHARGTFDDEQGISRNVAISLGPEYGTVGSDQVREAAKEAVKGVGFDLLLVCGFAFDAHSGEATKEFAPVSGGGWAVTTQERKFGKLPLMLVRMNQDLSMGEELLKQTGAGNLFMVFGEPDIQIDITADDEVEVEVRGVDVYDPTSGEMRSDTTDEIACWFIDTNYNGESFFVRDAYFTGANDPYKRLRQALKADIDFEAWKSLYRTRSRPFARPTTGKIAVKVINHHGDEVLKTYDVS